MPPVPPDIRAAVNQRAQIPGDGSAYRTTASVVVQYETLRRKLARMVALYERSRTFTPEQ